MTDDIISNSDEIIGKSDNNDEIKTEDVIAELKEEKKEEEERIFYNGAYLDNDISRNVNLGKLKRTLKDLCPECGGHLELRIRECETVELGEDVVEQEEYLRCSKCGLEFDWEEKRQRRKKDRTDRKIDVEDGGRNGRYQKSGSVNRNPRTNSDRSDRGGFRKGSQKTSRKY